MDSRIILVKPKFEEQTKEIFNYINDNSPQNAKKFIIKIDEKIKKIAINPFAYPKLLIFQKNDYRFSKYMKSWKIIFKITKTHLIFLGIIHSARSTKEIIKLKNMLQTK